MLPGGWWTNCDELLKCSMYLVLMQHLQGDGGETQGHPINFLSRSNPALETVCARYGALAMSPSFSMVANSSLKCGSCVCLSAASLDLYLPEVRSSGLSSWPYLVSLRLNHHDVWSTLGSDLLGGDVAESVVFFLVDVLAHSLEELFDLQLDQLPWMYVRQHHVRDRFCPVLGEGWRRC